MRNRFLTDLLSTIFERRVFGAVQPDDRPIEALCELLLSTSAEISGIKTARTILTAYSDLDNEAKQRFFHYMTEDLDLDALEVQNAAQIYGESPTREHLAQLTHAAEPPRQELLRRLNQVSGATDRLVNMRTDLLKLARENPNFARTDLDFKHLFYSWFNRGFLVLRRINWETPANILEKIIEYEAVHTINDWGDLKRRLQPEDRRCFAFFHPSMPDEPLIFLEVALTNGVSGSIDEVLTEDRSVLDIEATNTAVFYSISNCQAGLKGISFGNSLIKQVVEDLSAELPHLEKFITLSPLPGFNRWLTNERDNNNYKEAEVILEAVGIEDEIQRKDALLNLSHSTRELASIYLVKAKRQDGSPQDPVARFHLGNGAELHDIHALADLSPRGLSQSCGVMVNYLYDARNVEKNHEEFITNHQIASSRRVQSILPTKSRAEVKRKIVND
ncbi:MAG: decarboxylase [marine bacterium B5-7]|nr:MAG: decarboxylase [marine bacterium B5-7]